MLDKKKRTLIIVESPNKVPTISKILKDAGYNKCVVKASVGHICEIQNGGTYWNTGVEPENDFKTKYAVLADKKKIVSELKEQVELADEVYLATDPDREGEAIAWGLKKFLKIPAAKCHRVTFHEITENAVLKAFEKPRNIDDALVNAAHTRRIADRLIGYRLSPEARRKVQAKSVGRCQSAGLKLIADLERKIIDFVPDEYGELTLNFVKNGKEFKAKYFGCDGKEVKRPSYDYCVEVTEDCKKSTKQGDWFTVSDIKYKNKNSFPKPPFITSTFQQEVSSKLGISTKRSMEYAQKLFEGLNIDGEHIALITYIRTDSPEFAPEFLPILEKHVKSKYGKEYFAPIKEAKKAETAQDGHEAIRPVDLNMTPSKLAKLLDDKDLVKVYEIIYKRTVATMMAPAVTGETTYTIKCGKHEFHMVSKELVFDGYQKVYTYKDKDKTDDELVKETFSKGEVIDKSYSPSMTAVSKTTTPPARFKEATLIKELESCGIGRPSTFSTILSTLLDPSRGYCEVVDGCIVPTEKGMALSDFLDKSFGDIINVNYTSEMEKDLDLIANSKLDYLSFLKNLYNKLEETAKKVSGGPRPKAEPSDRVCPECGKPLVFRTGAYGRFLGCTGYPKCKYTEKVGNQ